MGIFNHNKNHRAGAGSGATVVTTTTTTTTNPHNGSAYPNTRAGRGTKPTLMSRLKGNNAGHTHRQTTTAAPVRKSHFGGSGVGGRHSNKRATAVSNGTTANGVPRRKVSMGDKMSGMMMKMKGSATHRPGEKAAGTRRMHGTDGKGSRRIY